MVATGEAIDEAEKATLAAQEAVSVTREIGEAQVRAYVEAIVGDFEGWPLQFAPDKATHIPIKLINSGQSPARRCVVLMTNIMAGSNFGSSEVDLLEDLIPIISKGSDIAAGGDIMAMGISSQLGAADYHLIIDPNSGTDFFVCGIIKYDDVFRKYDDAFRRSHRTRFCRKFRFAHDPTFEDPRRVRLNFDMTHYHNDSD